MSQDFVAPVFAAPANVPADQAVAGAVVTPVDNTSTAPATDNTKTPEPELTPRQKLEKDIAATEARIAKDTKSLADKKAKLDSIDKFASLTTGSQVEIKIGRAETARNVLGVVTGVKDGKYKVYHGEGFDADTVIVTEAQIVRVLDAQGQ